MPASLAQSFICRCLPFLPRKRLLAIDPGNNCVKLLVVEESFGRPRIVRHELVEIQGDGLISEEEVLRQAQDVIQDLGQNPIALAIPHYRALSQATDLPAAEPTEIRQLIEEESVKLSGLGESSIVYDYVSLQPYGRFNNPFWITLCREEEIQAQVQRCGLTGLDLCEVTTTANGMATSYLAAHSDADRVVLVDFGATGTVIVVLHRGQAIYANHFALGGDALTESIAARLDCSFELAENAKRSEDLGNPGEAPLPTAEALTRWRAELKRTLEEWLQEQSELKLASEDFTFVLCGGASLHGGLFDFLNRLGSLRFEPWSAPHDPRWPGPRFVAAYGAALQHLGHSRQPVSLLPSGVRQFWQGHHALNLLHSLILFLLAMLTVFLGLGTWQKYELLKSKELLLSQSQDALDKARRADDMGRQLRREYEQLRPLLKQQRQTLDALQALALVQQARSNQSLWFVLFADAQSYFSARPWGETNPPPPSATVPAPLPFKRGYIAELCVPEQGEAMRRTVSQLVASLKASDLFQNVDSLPEDRRRTLVDPAVLLPQQHFALALELPTNRFLALEPLPDQKPSGGPSLSPRRSSAPEEPAQATLPANHSSTRQP